METPTDTRSEEAESPGSACTGELHGLVRRWAELAPGEVSINATEFFGHIWTAKDRHGDADSNLWFHGDELDGWASILAGVLYHVTQRGMEARLAAVFSPGLMDHKRVGGATVTDSQTKRRAAESRRVEVGDTPGALGALVTASLAAYLNTLEAV